MVRDDQLHVLRGETGTGKTALLRALAQRGAQILDLEQLADHRGSAFGGLGRAQPSNELFQRRVVACWTRRRRDRPMFAEHEGPYIGSVSLPPGVRAQLCASSGILLRASRRRRIDHVLATYREVPDAQLLVAIGKLGRRLGRARHDQAVVALRAGDRARVVDLLLDYYDEAYRRQLADCTGPIVLEIELGERSFAALAELVLTAGLWSQL